MISPDEVVGVVPWCSNKAGRRLRDFSVWVVAEKDRPRKAEARLGREGREGEVSDELVAEGSRCAMLEFLLSTDGVAR